VKACEWIRIQKHSAVLCVCAVVGVVLFVIVLVIVVKVCVSPNSLAMTLAIMEYRLCSESSTEQSNNKDVLDVMCGSVFNEITKTMTVKTNLTLLERFFIKARPTEQCKVSD
jgi:hypothetical protein